MTTKQKQYVYENYLKIPLKEMCNNLKLKENHLDRFIASHTVAQMMDKFHELNGEGFKTGDIKLSEINQIEKSIFKSEHYIEVINGENCMIIKSKV